MGTIPDEFQKGDRVGERFEILGTLGRGGFGVVYHARAMQNGREFALKTYLKASEDRRAIARFRQESEIWIALGSHPYLVQAYFADEIDGRLFVGMELVRPGLSGKNDLESVLKDGIPPLDKTLRWSVQLCYAMEFAALRGIRAHRDLKPANIMLNEHEEVKVNDFGLATQPISDPEDDPATDRARFLRQTFHGIGFGTPTHMPPEQFDNATACDARSDIYSVGVMLFQMVTGTLPVQVRWPENASLENRMRYWRQMHDAHKHFVCPRLEHPLARVLQRCLETDPGARYPNFAALRSDLEVVAQAEAIAVPSPPIVRALSAKGWLARGKSLHRIGRHAQAIHALDACLKQHPEDEEALLTKADAYLSLGKAAVAQPLFDAVLLRHPNEARAMDGKARCLQVRGYPKEALALFDQAAKEHRVPAAVDVHRGRLLAELGRMEEARTCFERALEQSPLDAEALSAKGAHLLATGDAADALHLFERALSIHPLHLEASRGQPVAMVALGRTQEAIPLFRSLDRSGELHGRGRLAWAEALSRSGHAREALDLLGSVTASNLSSERETIRAQILMDLERPDDALKAWREVHADPLSGPGDPAAGQVLMILSAQETKALERVNDILAARPGHEATCIAASGAALRTGQDEQALQVCLHGLAFHPASATLRYQQGLALASLGRTDEAGNVFTALGTDRQAPMLLRQWAAHNAATLSGANPTGTSSVAAEGVLPATATLVPDHVAPTHPGALSRMQANGWHPRYRLPHLRPSLYLFPRWIPLQLSD